MQLVSLDTDAWHSPAHTGWGCLTKACTHILTGVGGPDGGGMEEKV